MSERKIQELERQLQQAKAREEEAKAREEEAKAREEEAKAREEEAKAREEEAKAREEEAKAREEEAKAREEEAKAREENERREKEEAKAREEDERRKNQKTTVTEYLHNCHFHLYQNLKLADASKSSTGLATSVDGRFYPRWLRPWKADTERQHHQQFEEIRTIHGEERLFHEQSTTINIGTSFIRKKAGNEKAVEYFEKSAVEEPTWNILEPIWKRKQLRQRYQCADLRFTDNVRDFRDESDDAQARRTDITPAITPPKLKPDGGGIRKGLDGKESVAFVYDYKAAHKFSVKHLEAALAKETLFVDVHEWVLCEQYARDPGLRKQEQEEARIAMALIQVFNYMLSYAVDYGFVTAGKSLVQLTYDRAEPLVLRWRLCIPNNVDAQGTTEAQISQLYQTAVAQLASFCLLSLRSTTLTGRSLEEALHHANIHLKLWKVTRYKDPATPPESDDKASPSAWPSRGTDKTYLSDGSPSTNKYPLRSRSRASCKDATMPSQTRDDDEGGDGDKRGRAESPQRRTRVGSSTNKRGQGSNKRKDSGSKNPASAFTRQYCTQACLLGLKHGHQLDRKCPNVLSHDVEGNGQHPLDAMKFTQLMAKQLREDVYEVSLALDGWGKCGISGVLFKLEMASLGYTFVGKGTTSMNPSHLTHEGKIYRRLSNLQGYIIPVHLGMVSLDPGYLLPGGARVAHMMLLSWAGHVASSKRKSEANRSIQTIYENGVVHQDQCVANLLWNAERRCVMVIDFHLASLIPEPKDDSRTRLKRKGNALQSDHGKRSLPRGFLQPVR